MTDHSKNAFKPDVGQAALDRSPISVVIMDPQTCQFRYCNAAAAVAYGFASSEEALGKTLSDVSASVQYDGQPSAEAAPGHIEQAMREGRHVFPWRHRRCDGVEWDAEVHLLRFEVEGAAWLQFSLIDMTERKRAEDALQSGQRRFSQLIENSFDTIVILDANGIQKYVSASAERVHGFCPAELVDIPVIDQMIHPDDRQQVLDAFQQIIVNGEGGAQYRHRHKAGGWVHLEARGTNQLANPDIQGILISVRNITDRKQVEEKLEKERAYLQGIINSIPGIFYLFPLTEDSKMLQWNDALREVTGYSDDEIGQMSPMQFMEPRFVDVISKKMKEVVETGSATVEATFVRKDGRCIPMLLTGKLLTINGIHHDVGVGIDISERKRSEEALANFQKLESLGILAGGIAHDFNNLMTGIFGAIDLAKAVSAEPQVQSYLDGVLQTLDRARALTGQLLTFSKGGAPKMETGSLFPFINDTVRFALSGSSVSCLFDIPDNIHSVSFDQNQLGQVIDNLVINAKQAMDQGGTITVSARNVSFADEEHPLLKRGDHVRISITDTGCGIPKENLQRIFDPFFSSKSTGHGLGLSTCFSIICRHEGAIDVVSELGKGTTFSIYLPASGHSGVSREGKTSQAHVGGGTILIMDDEPVVLRVVSMMLKSFGYTVIATVNGQDAVAQITAARKENRLPDALLFDLTVPGGMGGAQAIALIRQMGITIPAFVSSGYAEDPVMMNPQAYGFTDSISKPFVRAELAKMLEGYCFVRAGGRA